MAQTQMKIEDVSDRGERLYQEKIRAEVETSGNIGKMVIIDVDTGEYAVDDIGIVSAQYLQQKRPNADLYGVRIGYVVSEALGGTLERTSI